MSLIFEARFVGRALIFIGLLVLLIGEVTPVARLQIVDGLYVNQILFVGAGLLSLVVLPRLKNGAISLGWLILLFPMSFALIWGDNYEYGLYKLGNLYLATFISLVFFLYSIRLYGAEFFAKNIIYMLFALLVVAIVFKLKNGLFDREVLFFMSGPIVFARLMGIGAMLALVVPRLSYRVPLIIIFSIAVIWTASKGPILALIISYLVFFLLKMNLKQQIWSMASVAVFTFFLISNLDILPILGLGRVLDGLLFVSEGGGSGMTSSSISLRQTAMFDTIELIAKNPAFGVGVGSWALHLPDTGLLYPHNFFLEVLSEGGLIFGLLFCVPFLLFLVRMPSLFYFSSLFLFLAQQMSGDILDSRYWIIFSILSYSIYKNISVNRKIDISRLQIVGGQQ